MDKNELTSQAAVLDFYKEKIATDAAWALRALEVVYDHQTSLEKSTEHTCDLNNVGFGKCDAKRLSYYARIYKASKVNSKIKLRPEVIEYLKKKMPHYANQLVKFSIESGRVKKENGRYTW